MLLIIADLVAWPIAWWRMRDWLNTFDQRISLTPVPFVIAAAIALGIAIAMVVGHALKVALPFRFTRCDMNDRERAAFGDDAASGVAATR